MKVIFGLGWIKKRFKRPIVALGVFDGVHVGHQFLLNQVVSRAKKVKGTSIVLTFYPHPSHVLNPDRELPFLISLDERLRLFANLGIRVCVVVKFSKAFSKIKAEDFIRNYLIAKLHPQEICVGKDFVFGSDRKGTVKLLKWDGVRYGFKVNAISIRRKSGKVVSSTLIRNLVKKGKLLEVNRLLSRPVSVVGRVIRGAQKGKLLGFPTANIKHYKGILPPEGVYAVHVIWNRKDYLGMAFIGKRPAFITSDRSQTLEVNIFNFNKDIHGQAIGVEFLTKIREPKRFNNINNLGRQLKKDYQTIKKSIKFLTRRLTIPRH